MTFFSSFFKTGIDILLGANIGVLIEVWGKTLYSLVSNAGFYSIAGFWVFFFTTKSLIDKCDRKLRRKMDFELIMEDLGEEGV